VNVGTNHSNSIVHPEQNDLNANNNVGLIADEESDDHHLPNHIQSTNTNEQFQSANSSSPNSFDRLPTVSLLTRSTRLALHSSLSSSHSQWPMDSFRLQTPDQPMFHRNSETRQRDLIRIHRKSGE
jgi:hypothetical protein